MGNRKDSSVHFDQKRLLFIVQFAILLAIEAIVSFTPLGSLPALGPIVATLSHIPVIVTAITMGTGAGAAMGFFFGLFSFLHMSFIAPSPMSFVFTPLYSVGEFGGNYWSLVICFVPRILIGVVAGLSYRFLSKPLKDNFFSYTFSGILASLTNTLLVLGGIYLFFGKQFASVNKIGFELVLSVLGMMVLTSGIPEAIIGGILAYGVGKPLNKMKSKHF